MKSQILMMQNFNYLCKTYDCMKTNVQDFSYFPFLYPIHFIEADVKMLVYEDFQFVDKFILEFCSVTPLKLDELIEYLGMTKSKNTLKKRIVKLVNLGLIKKCDNEMLELTKLGQESLEKDKIIYFKNNQTVDFNTLLQVDGTNDTVLTINNRFKKKDFNNSLNKLYPKLIFKESNYTSGINEVELAKLYKSIKKAFELGKLSTVLDSNVTNINSVKYNCTFNTLVDCLYNKNTNTFVGLNMGSYKQVKLKNAKIKLENNNIYIISLEQPKNKDELVLKYEHNLYYFRIIDINKLHDNNKFLIRLELKYSDRHYSDKWDIYNIMKTWHEDKIEYYIAANEYSYGPIHGDLLDNVISIPLNGYLDSKFEFKEYNNKFLHKYIINNNYYENKNIVKEIFEKKLNMLINNDENYLFIEDLNERSIEFNKDIDYDILFYYYELCILSNSNFIFIPLLYDYSNIKYYIRLIVKKNKNLNSMLFIFTLIRVSYEIFKNIVKCGINNLIDECKNYLVENKFFTIIEKFAKEFYKFNEQFYENINSDINKQCSLNDKKLVDYLNEKVTDITRKLI